MHGKIVSQSDKDLAQQPLDKDGYSSDRFDKLYGKDKNPHLGSERDRKNRKGTKMAFISGPADWLKGKPGSKERLKAIEKWEKSQEKN